MNTGHLAAVGALADQLGYQVSLSELQARFEELSGNPENAFFILEENGIKGWIHLQIVSTLLKEKRVEIKALVVDESERSKGYGKTFLELAREWAKTNRVSTIYLSSNIMRDRAHLFYLREGFKQLKTSHFFELKI
jgi:GNAT superfamily N-acetyltransferase